MGMTGIFWGDSRTRTNMLICLLTQAVHALQFSHQFFHHIIYFFNLFGSVSVAAAEEKGVVFVSFCCIYQCLCDAVRNGFDIAVSRHWKQVLMAGRTPSLICCKNGFKIARPGIPTGLWVMTISSFFALM